MLSVDSPQYFDKATISEMSKKSGMDADVIIEKLTAMIAEHA